MVDSSKKLDRIHFPQSQQLAGAFPSIVLLLSFAQAESICVYWWLHATCHSVCLQLGFSNILFYHLFLNGDMCIVSCSALATHGYRSLTITALACFVLYWTQVTSRQHGAKGISHDHSTRIYHSRTQCIFCLFGHDHDASCRICDLLHHAMSRLCKRGKDGGIWGMKGRRKMTKDIV